jgi:hypothetical protein
MCQTPSSFLPFPFFPLYLHTRKIQLPSKNSCNNFMFFAMWSVSYSSHWLLLQKHLHSAFILYVSSQFNPQISKTGPSLDTKGFTLTHKRVKIEARRIDQTNTMVGILSCFPSKPLRNG